MQNVRRNNFPCMHRNLTAILLLILSYIRYSQALIQVPVSQKSYISPYSSSLQYMHAYFDINFNTAGELVQNDDNCTYFFSRTSPRSEDTFQFVQTNNTDMTTTIINQTIIMSGYQTYGMCQRNGSLDYVIALDTNSNELRVVRLLYDAFTGTTSVLDYKVVDRDPNVISLEGNIYVQCAYYSTYNSVNTYVIAMAGTYFSNNGLTNYYFAKFSTKYNMTEYFVISQVQNVMEQVRGVKVDVHNEMLYLALEVNKNKYNGRTVYAPGALPGQDNANVAILGYSWTFGVLEWTTVIGNPTYQDEFAGMDVWGNSLYVFTNSFSTKYSTNSSQTDIYYYRMRQQNGFVEASQIFGSPQDDKVFDIRATFNGVYVLALINNQLLPHKQNTKVWQTQNQVANLALIWIDFQDSILDIEGYSFDVAPSPYPTKLQVFRTGDHRVGFMLASHRDRTTSGLNAGIFLTSFASSTLLFQQGALCTDPNCAKCSPQNYSQCLQCSTGNFLWKHSCYSGSCPDRSFSVQDFGLQLLHYCKDCHPSCKTCTGSKQTQCSSCCINNICGSINNRVAGLGTCTCPAGLVDANGLCVQRCILNLAGKRQDMCYTECPQDSYADIKYDQATPQERSQYDVSSQTDCQLFSSHLKFSTTGKGLPLNGPSYLQSMPNEFTMAFWIRPTALNTISYFVNAFGRVQVRAISSNNQVSFIYSTSSTTTVEPSYSLTSSQRSIVLGAWNYISVALRSPTGFYEMQMAISNSNTGSIMNSGYSNTSPYVYYPKFVNTIYIGSFSDSNPQSFGGYLKEFRFFSIFHGYAQMQVEQMRMYRLYSYDDPYLVAYWKLSESYTISDYEYTIYDYSIYQNTIEYSFISEPNYPQYVYDESNTLSLCTFHDVAICRSLDYSKTHPYVSSAKRLTRSPTFILNDLSYTKQDGDEVWFQPNNTACSFKNTLAYMTYRAGIVNNFVIEDSTHSPVNLVEGVHYQVCYFINSVDIAFNLMQVYIMMQPVTINPSNSNSFLIAGATVKWMATGGDQAYNEIIQFSVDCNSPLSTDFALQRSNDPGYGTQSTTNFQLQGNYYFCWLPTYVMETSFPYYEPIHYLKYSIVLNPTVATTSISVANVNVDLIRFDFSGVFTDGDQLAFSWAGSPVADCKPANFLGSQFTYNYSHWPSIWFGQNSGVYGIQNRTMDMLHACYMSQANNNPGSWVRVKLTTQDTYDIKIQQFNTLPNSKCPELLSFVPQYGSTELYESNTVITFNFLNQAVYPSLAQDLPLIYGQIIIYRGAIFPDGTIQKTSQVLWQQVTLNDNHTPDPFQQGDLICTQTGQCSILLSTTSSRMKAGEIYFLSFFKNSFSSHSSTSNPYTRYYLFYNKTLPSGQTSVYDHLFFCRSFDVSSSATMINGKRLVVTGIDLVSKQISSVANNGGISSALFTTKSINLKLSVLNTADDSCTTSNPTATVIMTDVTQTSFTIKNLELGQCNNGALFAEIELTRGVMDQYGRFTYQRSEQLKNIQLGTIGCDPSCRQCNGTSSNNCVICADPKAFLLRGTCYASCPSSMSFYVSETLIFQKQTWTQKFCLSACPTGFYQDASSNECLACNAECQTCTSSYIASCLSCTPIAYLYSGICVPTCPIPHHQNNLTTYSCDQLSISSTLKVQIVPFGYKTRIPKSTQAYLKASIINDNVSEIINIKWSQIEPIPTSSLQVIFYTKADGNLDTSNAVSKLSMTAFNYMSSDQVVKVQCTVQNSLGEIAYDIYEFYLNDPPVLGNTSVSLVNGARNGTTIDSIYMLNMTGWYDARDSQFLSNIYILVNQVQYIVTEQTYNSVIYFNLPIVSSTVTTANISICVEAQDNDQGITDSCIDVQNVVNNLQYVNNYGKLITKLLALNYTSNITNALIASNTLYYGISSPFRDPSQPGICTVDFHCNFNGQCQSVMGTQTCICIQGYYGSFCQYNGTQLKDLQNITHMILGTLTKKLIPSYEIKRFDIGVIGTILRGIQNDPDILNDNDFETVIQLHEAISSASIYAHYPLNVKTRGIYFDGISASYLKLVHQRKIQRAYANVILLGQGFFSASTGSRRRLNDFDMQEIVSNDLFINNNQQDSSQSNSLISGQQKSRQHRNLEMSTNTELKFQTNGRRMTDCVNQFIYKTLLNLNPAKTGYTQISGAFQLKIVQDYASSFTGIQVYIQELDVYWNLPEGIFDKSQGYASDSQYISMLAMKWIANPFQFEMAPGSFIESNVTTFSFLDPNAQHIDLEFSSNNYIEIREPWNKTEAYDLTLLRCMAWNETTYEFDDDDSCGFSMVWDVLPCLSCASNEMVNTTIGMCRCSHLSTFASAYEQTVVGRGAGPQVGLYSNFFALQYWRNSFGYYIVLAGIGIYMIGIIITIMVDKKIMPGHLAKLRDKVRRLELRGFKQIEDYEIEKVIQKEVAENLGPGANNQQNDQNQGPLFEAEKPAHGKTKGKYEDAVEEFKFGDQNQISYLPQADRYEDSPIKKPTAGKKAAAGSKKLLPKKSQIKEIDQLNQSQKLLPVKGKKLPNKNKSGQVAVETAYMNNKAKANDQHYSDEEVANYNDDENRTLNTDEARDALDREMRMRYDEEVKKRKDGMIQLTGEDQEEEELTMLEKQKKYKHMENKRLEKYMYRLKIMLIHSCSVPSIIYVTSLITPRHARWTMFYINVVLNCFWCAVIFNNTQDPLTLPDNNRKARNVAYQDLWISVVSPIGSIILMYVFAGLFKISDARISKSYTSTYFERMMFELKKEMRLRYILAYFITVCFFGASSYYIIQFSSTFGWKTSWIWWYSCLFALLIQFLVLDPLITITHWVIYQCSRQFALFIMKIRWLKQTKSEIE